MRTLEPVLVALLGGLIAAGKVWLYGGGLRRWEGRGPGRLSPRSLLVRSAWVGAAFAAFVFVLLLLADRS